MKKSGKKDTRKDPNNSRKYPTRNSQSVSEFENVSEDNGHSIESTQALKDVDTMASKTSYATSEIGAENLQDDKVSSKDIAEILAAVTKVSVQMDAMNQKIDGVHTEMKTER